MRVFVLRLYTKFEVPKIMCIYCVSINRPGDLDLLTSKQVHELLV